MGKKTINSKGLSEIQTEIVTLCLEDLKQELINNLTKLEGVCDVDIKNVEINILRDNNDLHIKYRFKFDEGVIKGKCKASPVDEESFLKCKNKYRNIVKNIMDMEL